MLIQPHGNGIKLVNPPNKKILSHTSLLSVADIFKFPMNVFFTNTENIIQNLNESTALLTGFSSLNSAIGNTIYKVSKKQTADVSIDHNKRVMANEQMEIIEEHFMRSDDISFPAITSKFPWYSADGKIIGAFGFSIAIGKHPLAKSLTLITQTGLLRKNTNNDLVNAILPGKEICGVYLSKRELECLYYLIRGKTAKMTGKALTLSHRTVEEYIDNIKKKLSVNSKSELIELIIDKIFL